jgi:hypothetical protein
MDVLVVDFDGGYIGTNVVENIRNFYHNTSEVPTFKFYNTSDFASPDTVISKVNSGDVW